MELRKWTGLQGMYRNYEGTYGLLPSRSTGKEGPLEHDDESKIAGICGYERFSDAKVQFPYGGVRGRPVIPRPTSRPSHYTFQLQGDCIADCGTHEARHTNLDRN